MTETFAQVHQYVQPGVGIGAKTDNGPTEMKLNDEYSDLESNAQLCFNFCDRPIREREKDLREKNDHAPLHQSTRS